MPMLLCCVDDISDGLLNIKVLPILLFITGFLGGYFFKLSKKTFSLKAN